MPSRIRNQLVIDVQGIIRNASFQSKDMTTSRYFLEDSHQLKHYIDYTDELMLQ